MKETKKEKEKETEGFSGNENTRKRSAGKWCIRKGVRERLYRKGGGGRDWNF
jgi:hypothetical protein